MKITFDPMGEKAEINRIIKSDNAYRALWDVAQEIFRPARKHGYNDTKLNELLEKCGENGYEIVSMLEDKFYEILSNENIDIYSDLE